MILLHVYHPNKRREDQEATWAFCTEFERHEGTVVVHYPTKGPDGYWQALELVWGYDGHVVVLEQDIVPTWRHIVDLLACPPGYCSWDFKLAHGVPWSKVPGGHGFGLAKFSAGLRSSILPRPQVPHLPWPDTVPALHERLGDCHVHRPLIEHHHVGD